MFESVKGPAGRARGFGVIEAMIFASIASVFVLGTVAMVTKNSYQIKLMNARTSRDDLARSLRAQMADPFRCTGALAATDALTGGGREIQLRYNLIGTATAVAKGLTTADGVLSIKSFHVANLTDANLVGGAGFPVSVGDLVLDAQAVNGEGDALQLRPIALGKVFLETTGQTIKSCFNSNGAYGAAAMACLQFNGINGVGSVGACNTDPFRDIVDGAVQTWTDTTVRGTFTENIRGEVDTTLSIRTAQIYDDIMATSKRTTDDATRTQSTAIVNGYSNANAIITSTDQDRQNQVNNLWNGENGVNPNLNVAVAAVRTSTDANSAATSANQNAQYANALAEQAARTGQVASQTGTLANQVANEGLQTAQYAQNVSNQAQNTAQSSTGVASAAANTAYQAIAVGSNANQVANNAYNVAMSSYNYATSAYNTSNYANQVALNAEATASYAVNVADGANATASYAANTANSASWTAQQAYNTPYQQSNQTVVNYDCSLMPGGSCQ